jgi:hypothetical protein
MTMTKYQYCALLVLAVAGFLGGGVSNLLLRGVPAMAQTVGAQGAPTVTASQFVLVNGAGKRGATLGFGEDGTAGLWLCDAAGRERTWLRLDNYGNGFLTMADANENVRATLGCAPRSGSSPLPYVWLADAAGKAGVSLGFVNGLLPGAVATDTNGKTRAQMGMLTSTTSGVELWNANGTVHWKTP